MANKRTGFIFLLVLLIQTSAFADFTNFWARTEGNYFVSASLGSVMGNVGKNQQLADMFTVGSESYPVYFTANNTASNLDYGISGGLRTLLSDQITLLWGVGFFQSSRKVDGYLYRPGTDATGDPDFSYQYNFADTRLMLSAKSEYQFSQRWYPYASIGFGFANLHVTDYTTKRLNEPSGAYQFGNASKTEFAYQIGLGVTYQLNQDWFLDAGYQFIHLGSIALKPAWNQTSGVTPSTATLNLSRLALSARYQF